MITNEKLNKLVNHAIATFCESHASDNEVGFDNGLGLKISGDRIRLFVPFWEQCDPEWEAICEPELTSWEIEKLTPQSAIEMISYGLLTTKDVKAIKAAIASEIKTLCVRYIEKLSRQGSDDILIYLAEEEFQQGFGDDVDKATIELKDMIEESLPSRISFFKNYVHPNPESRIGTYYECFAA